MPLSPDYPANHSEAKPNSGYLGAYPTPEQESRDLVQPGV